jgi:DNA polymerase-4
MAKDYSQGFLFEQDRKRERLLQAMDGINDRFGEYSLTWGRILERTKEPGVISPSWRPAGVKRVEVR